MSSQLPPPGMGSSHLSMADEFTPAQLAELAWQALFRHKLGDRQKLVAEKVIELSYELGQYSLELDRGVEMARLCGLSRHNAHTAVDDLLRGRVIERSEDRRIITFMPPSRNWPWLFRPRATEEAWRAADELETAIRWRVTGVGRQGELFPASVEEELALALRIERIRTALYEHHQALCRRMPGSAPAAGPQHFPVRDRVSDAESSSCELFPASAAGALAERPPGTAPGVGVGISAHGAENLEVSPERHQPPLVPCTTSSLAGEKPVKTPAEETSSSEKMFSRREQNVLTARTPFKSLTVLESSGVSTDPDSSKALETLKECSHGENIFPAAAAAPSSEVNRLGLPPALDLAADENTVIRYLVKVLGEKVMNGEDGESGWGGWYRLRYRGVREFDAKLQRYIGPAEATPATYRRALMQAIYQQRLRWQDDVLGVSQKKVKNWGGWLRDEFRTRLKIFAAEEKAGSQQGGKPVIGDQRSVIRNEPKKTKP